MTKELACKSCGAPVTPGPSDVRVTCSYCGATMQVSSEAALRLAEAVAGKITVSPKLMSREDVQALVDEREREKREKLRHARLVAAITGGIFVVVLLVVLLLVSLPR